MVALERQSLPIDPFLPDIRKRLDEASALVLTASPGAGKTTKVPLALLEASWLAGKKIVMLEPRRVAARAAARRIAALHGSPLGETVGYQVRFDRMIGPRARIEILTEGLLTRRLQSDPFLEDVGAVIFDEFHERSLHADLALALCREIRETVRPDLRLIVMSATLAAEPVSRFLGDAPRLQVPGFLHPVTVSRLERSPTHPLPQVVAGSVLRALAADPDGGDLLVFLPGEGEIYRVLGLLESEPACRDLLILPLHGTLPLEKQDQALFPQARRKVILATNIAETSLTIEGVTTVIDSGLCRRLRLDPATGLERLETERISRASADQRTGRAGRLGPGRAVRLWTASDEQQMVPDIPPEIARIDLTGLVLELAAWGKPDPMSLPWLEPPPVPTINAARDLLRLLGAIDETGKVTPTGRRMVDLPVHPRVARMVLQARHERLDAIGADLAALIGEKDLVLREARRSGSLPVGPSDLLARLDLLESARAANFRGSGGSLGGIDLRAAQSVDRVAGQLRDMIRRLPASKEPVPDRADLDQAALRVLLAGFPDRVAKRRERPPGSTGSADTSYLMVGGRGLRLHSESVVRDAELVIAVAAEGSGNDAVVRMASRIDAGWLMQVFPHAVREERELAWDGTRKSVGVRRRLRYADLVLSETIESLRKDDLEPALALLVKHAAAEPREALSWNDDAEQFCLRVALVRSAPEGKELPSFDEAWMIEHLPTISRGCRSYADLRERSLKAFFEQALAPHQRALVDRLAPERLRVPTGSTIKLTYRDGESPILAVKLQELFGQTATPRILNGRQPVLIHLLSPAGRPLQITQDLASFWANAYPALRREMRGQYPRHPWPEDPLTAPPQRGVVRRRS